MGRTKVASPLGQVILHWFPYVFPIALSLLVFRQFFSPGSIMVADFVPPSIHYVWTGELTTLNPNFAGGSFNVAISVAPVDYLISLLSVATSPETSYRFFYVACTAVAGASAVTLVREFDSNHRLGVISTTAAGIVYAMNPWVITEAILPGHFSSVGWAYALTPLLVVLWFRWLKTRDFRYCVITGLFLTLIGAIFYVWLLILLPFFVLFPLLTPGNIRTDRFSVKYFSDFLASFPPWLIALAASAYWIVPIVSLFFGGGATPTAPSPTGVQTVSQNLSFVNVVRLLGFWSSTLTFQTFSTGNPVLSSLYFVASFSVPALALPPLLFPKSFRWSSTRLWIFCVVAFLFYATLAQGTLVLGYAYVGLARALPVLTDGFLFVSVIALIYCLTIPLTFEYLWSVLSGPRHENHRIRSAPWRGLLPKPSRRMSVTVGALVAFALLGASIWPVFTGDFNGQYMNLDEPASYSTAYEWLAGHLNNTMALWLPSTGSYLALNWSAESGYNSISDPVRWQSSSRVLNPPYVSADSNAASLFIAEISFLLTNSRTRDIGALLAANGVGALVIRTDVEPLESSELYLDSALNQSDLSLKWTEPPLYIFTPTEPVTFARDASAAALVYGGFNWLAGSSWYGTEPQRAADFLPEMLGAVGVQQLLAYENTTIILPSVDRLDFVASLTPSRYWIPLTDQDYPDWTYDYYAGATTGDALAGGALVGSGLEPLEISIPVQDSSQYVLLLRLAGGPSDYTVSVDGKVVSATYSAEPGAGFVWGNFSTELSAGTHTLDILPTAGAYPALGGLILLPLSEYRSVVAQIDSFSVASRTMTVIPASQLFPAGPGFAFDNLYSSGVDAPAPFALTYPPSGLAYAGTNGNFSSIGGAYVISTLALANSPNGQIELVLYGPGSPIHFFVSIPNRGLGWTNISQVIPAGNYTFVVGGTNVSLAAVTLMSAAHREGATSSAVNADPFAIPLTLTGCPTACRGETTIAGPSVVSVAFAYSHLWGVTVNGDAQGTLASSGLDLAFVALGNNGTAHFTITYLPQTSESISSAVSAGTLLVGGIVLIALQIRRRLNRQSSKKSIPIDWPGD